MQRVRTGQEAVTNTTTREQSKLLFGNSNMFAFLCALRELDTDEFTMRDLLHRTDIPTNIAYGLLSRCIKLGIVAAVDESTLERATRYRRLAHPLLAQLPDLEQAFANNI